MESFSDYMDEYQAQLHKGVIQKAYKGLMEYFLVLRAHFSKNYPQALVSGNIYFGYMDMSYFSVIPKSLKVLNLKIAIVFLHEACRFEAWLAGSNKQVQAQYWKLIQTSGWNKYQLVPSLKGADSILEHVLVENPDFSDLVSLTTQIESESCVFIKDVENFLGEHPLGSENRLVD